MLFRSNSFLNSLELDFCSDSYDSTNLNMFIEYNSAIICFIYNLFYVLEKYKSKCYLSSLIISTDDLTDEKVYIISDIQNKFNFYKDSKRFILNELKITNLHLNISNISLILPFQYFPMVNLRELCLEKLSYIDLDNLTNALKNDKQLFIKLNNLVISLNYMIEDFIEKINC